MSDEAGSKQAADNDHSAVHTTARANHMRIHACVHPAMMVSRAHASQAITLIGCVGAHCQPLSVMQLALLGLQAAELVAQLLQPLLKALRHLPWPCCTQCRPAHPLTVSRAVRPRGQMLKWALSRHALAKILC